MFFGKQKSLLGIDIGTSSIKLVQLNHGTKPVLETYGIVDIPEPITAQTTEKTIKEIAGLLTSLIEHAHVTTKRCAMSLPNAAVFTSVIEMPKMSDDELESAIQFEAKKYVPLPFTEVTLSWTIISESEDKKMNRILLIAVPKQIRDTYIKVFQIAGLNLEIIEIEALALIRALVVDATKNDVIIDIGSKVTGINFVRGGLLQLTRNLNIGGESITERIAQVLNITVPRAEQFKQDFGLNGTDFLPEAVKPVLGTIKNEVSQLVGIYKSHNVNVDRVVLVGGGSQLPGIVDYFKDVNAEIQIGDPLGHISYPESVAPVLTRFSPHIAIAVGLALRKET